ncbi:hypothetical protein LTR22_026343, partial [Elasticomyces elasticus]
CGKEAGQEITDETANAVDGEDVKAVVSMNPVLDLSCKIAANASTHAVNDSRPGWNIARARRNRNQASYNIGAEAHSRPFALEAVVNEAPSHARARKPRDS